MNEQYEMHTNDVTLALDILLDAVERTRQEINGERMSDAERRKLLHHIKDILLHPYDPATAWTRTHPALRAVIDDWAEWALDRDER